MNEINYKMKYQELKSKFMSAVDSAFRLGFEQGMKEEQMSQMAQAQQQAMNQPGIPGQEDGTEQAEVPQGAEQEQVQEISAHPEGSELDQHIAKLESMLGKSEIKEEDLKKAIEDFKNFQAMRKQEMELKKSAQAIKGISKALHKPKFKMSVQASHNLKDASKKAVTMQEKIVKDIMKSWAEEEKKASDGIQGILKIEGLTND